MILDRTSIVILLLVRLARESYTVIPIVHSQESRSSIFSPDSPVSVTLSARISFTGLCNDEEVESSGDDVSNLASTLPALSEHMVLWALKINFEVGGDTALNIPEN